MKKVKYNFKKIQEGMINNYGFVELPLQKVGIKGNGHDEFVARMSENEMDPEKVQQAGEFIDALETHPIHQFNQHPDNADDAGLDNYYSALFDYAEKSVNKYINSDSFEGFHPDILKASGGKSEPIVKHFTDDRMGSSGADWSDHKENIDPRSWAQEFHLTYGPGYDPDDYSGIQSYDLDKIKQYASEVDEEY
tara:strand:+ start:3618 stop:4196 length:579 start_codon:yes stop_codon:yes gene_type:complete